jgi:hypothetical protein
MICGLQNLISHDHLQQQQNPNNLKNDEKDMKYFDLLITLK